MAELSLVVRVVVVAMRRGPAEGARVVVVVCGRAVAAAAAAAARQAPPPVQVARERPAGVNGGPTLVGTDKQLQWKTVFNIMIYGLGPITTNIFNTIDCLEIFSINLNAQKVIYRF